MELNFEKEGDKWVATTEVNDDYNVHVEYNELATTEVQQRTQGTQFATKHSSNLQKSFDDDFDARVYPKQIKIIASAQPVWGGVRELE